MEYKITFMCIGKPKNEWFTLLQYSLSWTEPIMSPRYACALFDGFFFKNGDSVLISGCCIFSVATFRTPTYPKDLSGLYHSSRLIFGCFWHFSGHFILLSNSSFPPTLSKMLHNACYTIQANVLMRLMTFTHFLGICHFCQSPFWGMEGIIFAF